MDIDNSILLSIKRMLGIDPDENPFDGELIMFINSALFTLMQLGVGPSEAFSISSFVETWTDFLGESLAQLQSVKEYVYLYVRLVFDPPTSSSVQSAFEEKKRELEWRLKHQMEEGGMT